MPGQGPPIVDAGNPLLDKVPVQLATVTVDGPAGQLALLTFRTASTTFTAMVTAAELDGWINVLRGLASTMSASGLTVVRGTMTIPDISSMPAPGGRPGA